MANVTIRLDSDDKNEFSAICDKIGLSVSSAFNIFVKTVIHEQGIPFMLSAKDDGFNSKANISYLEKIKKLDDEGKLKFVEHTLEEIDRMAK
ncbi:MAG: type II toxin-antitoxin system RelB/DinJ family antitoxin [Treponema sp.]|jgi:DNA-damage-inducible protein J|nr:type II toxin-antitoxin system RelB/DinJ family antitoxin [Treponema sp.]